MKLLPRYPIYVPSKGRWKSGLTAKFLIKENVPFKLVVEPKELEIYANSFGSENCLALPWDNAPGTLDSLIRSRNWIKQHSIAAGALKHWQLDDNIRGMFRLWRNKRIRCDSGPAFAAVEDFVDRYENVPVSGMNYTVWGRPGIPAYFLNCHVYSCTLIDNSYPFNWKLVYNEDTDLCLQVLAAGYCTLLVNVFLVEKMQTMKVKGGNTAEMYRGDGRLRMARMLERAWPYVVTTGRRFKRPQHVVRGQWRYFDTPLKLKPGVDIRNLPPNDYGLHLVQVGASVDSPVLRKLLQETSTRRRRLLQNGGI